MNQSNQVAKPLLPNQEKAVNWLGYGKRVGYADSVGSGKSRSVIEAVKNSPGNVLILSTALAVTSSWPEQLETWVPGFHRSQMELVTEKDLLPRALSKRYTLVTLDAFMNNPSITSKWKPHIVVIDEAHKIPLYGSQGFNNMTSVLHEYWYRKQALWLVTASPVRNKLEELWRLYHLLHPTKYSSFYRWKEQMLQTNLVRTRGGGTIKQVANAPREKGKFAAEFESMFLQSPLDQSFTTTIIPVHLKLGELQRTMYNQFLEDGWLETLDPDDPFVYNKGILTQYMRLSQVCISPKVLGIDGPSVKFDWLLEHLESHDEQVLVGSNSSIGLKCLLDFLRQYKVQCELLIGSTPTSKREEICEKFKSKVTRVLLMSMPIAESVTFTNCRILVGMDCPWVPEMYRQWYGRCAREGQTKPVLIYNLTASPVDEHFFSNMSGKDVQISSLHDKATLTSLLSKDAIL